MIERRVRQVWIKHDGSVKRGFSCSNIEMRDIACALQLALGYHANPPGHALDFAFALCV